jgi:RNA polymerase sigma-B factor
VVDERETRLRAEHRVIELERFQQWRATGDVAIRDSIVADAQGIAIGLAKRFRDRGAEMDDLVQVAQVGLLHAVTRFDPDRGVPFLAFAAPTVLGELRRHFRSMWSVHVPRSLQEASLRLSETIAELQQELGSSPTIQEIADRLGCPREDVVAAIEVSGAFRPASLDQPFGISGDSRDDLASLLPVATGEDGFEQVEAREMVARLLPRLSPRTRQIVELRYFEERSQSEIAAIVGLSQMHVSRVLRQAMATLAESDPSNEV